MKVLLVESEHDIQSRIQHELEDLYCCVETAQTGQHATSLIEQSAYDAIITGLYLDDMSGAELCSIARQTHQSVPLIVVSRPIDQETKVDMLRICDDYVEHPICPKELYARIQATRRRGPVICSNTMTACDLCLDSIRHEVTLRGEKVYLRNKEFDLLEYFMRHYGEVLSRERILSEVWDRNINIFTNTVDVHVRMLRKKLDSDQCAYIQTLPRKGYRFIVQRTRG